MAKKKLESSLKNMILSLLFISIGMSAALAYVFKLTEEPIAAAMKAKEIAAITEVLPPFDNDPTLSPVEVEGIVFYKAKKGEELVGFAVKTFTDKGFSGRFTLMVGILPTGIINKVSVLDQKETPGLGDKMKTKWKDQFSSKDPDTFRLDVKKDGGDVDAITASTITSRAFCDALKRAHTAFKAKFVNQADTTQIQ